LPRGRRVAVSVVLSPAPATDSAAREWLNPPDGGPGEWTRRARLRDSFRGIAAPDQGGNLLAPPANSAGGSPGGPPAVLRCGGGGRPSASFRVAGRTATRAGRGEEEGDSPTTRGNQRVPPYVGCIRR